MADEVADQELLWRRIHESHDLGDRPSSAAFLDPEMSVDREHLVSGEEPRHRVTQADGVGVGEFTAAVPRGHGHEPVAEPVEGNPAHAVVYAPAGAAESARRRVARALATSCTYLK